MDELGGTGGMQLGGEHAVTIVCPSGRVWLFYRHHHMDFYCRLWLLSLILTLSHLFLLRISFWDFNIELASPNLTIHRAHILRGSSASRCRLRRRGKGPRDDLSKFSEPTQWSPSILHDQVRGSPWGGDVWTVWVGMLGVLNGLNFYTDSISTIVQHPKMDI